MKLLLVLLGLIPTYFCGSVIYNEKESIQDDHLIKPDATPTYYADHTGCGGVIPVSHFTKSRILYKNGKLFDPYESCVWTLAVQDNVTNVQVYVYQNITEAYDGITAYFADSTGLTRFKLPRNNTSFNVNTPLAFLVFSSDVSVQSNGFEITITSTGVPGPRSVGAYHVRKENGQFQLNLDSRQIQQKTVALVLQGKSSGFVSTELQINLSNVQINEGSIQVYALNSHYNSGDYGLLGRFTTDAQIEVTPMNPVLILLESTTSLQGNSFQVEWKPYVDSIP